MNFKLKNKSGITLIALIITIIVMLILVGVVVTVVIQSNLLGTAKTAGDKYKTAYEEESNMSQIEINGKKYDSIEDYLAGVESIPEIHNWVRTGDNIKCEHCNTSLTIGQKVNYTKTGAGSSSISEEKSGIAQAKTDGQSWATSYGVQTVNIASDDTKWVVLGVEDSNKNGTNETLLLTTETPTTGKIRMYGYQPYNHAVDEINRMCKEIYGVEARGMTIEDVNACLQYTAPAGMYYQNSKWNSIGNLTTKLKDIPTWDAIKGNHQTPDGKNTEEALGEYPLDGYWYVADSTVGAATGVPVLPDSTTTATKTLIFGTNNSNRYWLASRGVYADSDYAFFGPGAVGEGGAGSVGDNCLFDSFGRSYGDELPLRCVVYLRSDIPAVVADSGSGEL